MSGLLSSSFLSFAVCFYSSFRHIYIYIYIDFFFTGSIECNVWTMSFGIVSYRVVYQLMDIHTPIPIVWQSF